MHQINIEMVLLVVFLLKQVLTEIADKSSGDIMSSQIQSGMRNFTCIHVNNEKFQQP